MATVVVREGWATPQEAADYLGFSVLTLKNWRSQGKGPRFSKPGRAVRYRWTDLEAWMTSQNP